jgi:lipopolysaccharide/colanic/teichoic acid biosynthesis glycosyltransferase
MMSIKGSSSDMRRPTKGGSLHTRRSDAFDHSSAPALVWRDNDPSSFLRKVVVDLFQKQRVSPSFVDGQQKLNGSAGNGAVLQVVDDIALVSRPKVPGWKYVLDVSLISLSMPIWLPVMLVVMLITKICSTGPIFYRQVRIGLSGRRFSMWKFRTMKLSAETKSHERHLEELIRSNRRMTKLDAGDPRLVPFGRILRASGLDELPQIFNVLRGEMSLVGPRPCLPNEFASYEPWQKRRVDALPGLTGYWQVNGKNNTTFKQMVAMDLSYLENMSIGLDLKIILMTGGAILAQVLESRD